jgi:hypothetical protein
MRGEVLEEWQKLCDQAANEQDPKRLLELVKRINELLEQKEQRLQSKLCRTSLADKEC